MTLDYLRNACGNAASHLLRKNWAFLGILFVAIGEMVSSPRIQEYITWIAPKEKAGMFGSYVIGARGEDGSFEDVGDVDGSPTLLGSTLYVGNNVGEVHALDLGAADRVDPI